METQLHKYTVENLRLENVEWFVEVAATSMLEHELKRPELININHLYSLTVRCMEQESIFIAKYNGVPIGAIAGIIAPNLYNPSIVECIELFWYILPQYRKSRAGVLLLNAFIERGEREDVITFSLLPSSNINARTLEKRGFRMGETGYIKEKEK